MWQLYQKAKVIQIASQKSIGGKDYRVNEEITGYDECRLIDETGDQLGIMPLSEAQELSIEKMLDLVEISPDAKPPVCKLMDYGKFKYDLSKKQKAAKKTNTSQKTKEVKFTPNIDTGDYNTKLSKINKFIDSGYKVKITIMFRGRLIDHPELGLAIMDRLVSDLEDHAAILQAPKLEGRNMSMVLVLKS